VTTLEDALVKLAEGKLDEGRRMLEKLLGRDPTNPVILYNLGMCFSELGLLDKSVKALERCLKLDPENAKAYTALGVTYSRQSKFQEAAEELRIALRIDPAYFYAMRNLGAVYCQMGEIDEGIHFLEEANQRYPDTPEVLYGLALAHEQKGDIEQAEPLYRQVTDMAGAGQLAELAKQAMTRIATQALQSRGPRLDAVMYLLAALKRLSPLDPEETRSIAYEIGLLGRRGLDINDPTAKYTLQTLEGSFSGLQLLCYMYVGFKLVDPTVDVGADFDKEYEAAYSLFRSEPGED
jgi:tetratricopeptide (TPR) repeat protein